MKFLDITKKSADRKKLDSIIVAATDYGQYYVQNYGLQLWMHSSSDINFSGIQQNQTRSISNKPNAFWSSTAIPQTVNSQEYSSDWVRWVLEEMPEWYSKYGFLLGVKGSPKILSMNTTRNAVYLFSALKLAYPDKIDYDLDTKYGGLSSFRYPWDLVALEFDAVHYSNIGADRYGFFYGWDCESTAWLNTQYLFKLKRVSIQTK